MVLFQGMVQAMVRKFNFFMGWPGPTVIPFGGMGVLSRVMPLARRLGPR
jgi:hypothetical protein